MKTIPRLGAIGAAVALAAAGFFAAMPAGAATHDIHSNLTGGLTLTLPGTPPTTTDLTAPDGSVFDGSWDDSSGDLTGTVQIADGSFTVPGTLIGDATVDFSFTNGGPITNGSIASDNTVTFTDVETVNLDRVEELDKDLSPCSVGPVTLDYSGTYDPATQEIDVTSNSVDVPALTDSCGGLSGIISPLLDGASVTSHLVFSVADENVTTTTSTSTTSTSSSTSTTSTTTPSIPLTTITNVTSNGCNGIFTIDFVDAGHYTLTLTTEDGQRMGSAEVTVDAPGTKDVTVDIDDMHGLKHGDPVEVTLTDANGTVVTSGTTQVNDPDACTNKPTTPAVKKVSQNSGAANPVSGTPKYTG